MIRCCFINPRTGGPDVDGLVEEVRRTGDRLLGRAESRARGAGRDTERGDHH